MVKHNSGYELSTKSGIPWDLQQTEEYKTRGEVMQREYEVKSKKTVNI